RGLVRHRRAGPRRVREAPQIVISFPTLPSGSWTRTAHPLVRVAVLADALACGASARIGRGGSSPPSYTGVTQPSSRGDALGGLCRSTRTHPAPGRRPPTSRSSPHRSALLVDGPGATMAPT